MNGTSVKGGYQHMVPKYVRRSRSWPILGLDVYLFRSELGTPKLDASYSERQTTAGLEVFHFYFLPFDGLVGNSLPTATVSCIFSPTEATAPVDNPVTQQARARDSWAAENRLGLLWQACDDASPYCFFSHNRVAGSGGWFSLHSHCGKSTIRFWSIPISVKSQSKSIQKLV